MQLRWTEEAANDLTRIADYLLIHAPDRASDLIRVVPARDERSESRRG